MFTQTFYGSLLLTVAWILVIQWRRRGKLPLPPGPRHIPLYGSVFRRTEMYQADTFGRFSRELKSDVVSLTEWGNCTVVLNTFGAVNSLLIRNSSHSATRPPTWRKFRDWGGLHTSIPHLEYGEGWKARRQTFNHLVSAAQLPEHEKVQLQVAQSMLLAILNEPEKAVFFFYEMMGGLILTLVYGISELPNGETHIGLAERALGGILYTFTREFQVACIVNRISRILPLPESLFPIKKTNRMYREDVESQTYVPFQETKRQMMANNVSASFVTEMLSQDNVDADLEIIIRDAAGSLYSGALIATGSLLFTFMMSMAWFPEVQSKAQKELDLLLGHGNLPTFSICHPSKIPYTWSLILEAMRWRPPVSLGLDHSSDVDEEYEGLRIPAGSSIIANLKTILFDPEVYKNPETFQPERFLKSNGEFDPDVFDPRQVIFGFGRRKCPGRDIAFTSLVISIVSTLASFDIVLRDEHNASRMSRDAAIASFIAIDIPLKFPHDNVLLKPRSQETATAIRAAV